MADSMNALKGIVELLTPLQSEERGRVMRAAMAFFGEATPVIDESNVGFASSIDGLPPRALAWMKQNSITADQIQEVFQLSGDSAEVIVALPGKSKKVQTYNAYVITGIGRLLITGTASFDDKDARELCEKSGCYDSANHSAHLRDRGNEFAGSKDKGWTLTAPGLKRGAELVKEMQAS